MEVCHRNSVCLCYNAEEFSINPSPSLTLQSALVVLFVNLLRYVIETEALCCLM